MTIVDILNKLYIRQAKSVRERLELLLHHHKAKATSTIASKHASISFDFDNKIITTTVSCREGDIIITSLPFLF